MNYLNPITIDKLINIGNNNDSNTFLIFKIDNNLIYKAQRSYNSYVKEHIVNK